MPNKPRSTTLMGSVSKTHFRQYQAQNYTLCF